MRIVRAFWLICGLAGLVSPVLADQTDARLGGLFSQLNSVKGAIAAAPIESQIWAIWIENDDEAVQVLMRRGMERMGAGDLEAALKAFDQIVATAPGFAEGWNKRATVHYLIGNYAKSLVDIDRTLALEPRHFGALSGRGLIFIRLKELERALTAFEAALTVHPNMPGPRNDADAIRRFLQQRDI